MMYDAMTDQGGDWCVSAPEADSPNIRHAHLCR